MYFVLIAYVCVNIKCSGWTLNLYFFCETAAGKCHNAYKIDAAIWQYFQGDGEAKDTKLILFLYHADFIVKYLIFSCQIIIYLNRFPHFLIFLASFLVMFWAEIIDFNITVPELETAFGLRLSSIFSFHEFFQIQISWMNNCNFIRVNIKCSGWTLNLCFFCETAAGKLQKKMSSNIYCSLHSFHEIFLRCNHYYLSLFVICSTVCWFAPCCRSKVDQLLIHHRYQILCW